MLVDTHAIHTLGADCSNHSDDLSVAATTLSSLPGAGAATAFGPVGAAFLAVLADAVMVEARAVAALSEDLASAHGKSGALADAYAAADRRGSHLL
ncbi:hypothetical protein [Mycobacterium sp. 1274761.0]|uniref:hypothetical protein n=1 Tax=Mycobacterium sp. 1274761.0 TaxID=1834077 RepID=UPI0007FC8ECD|nr:hypothetical protein [Mycobacterium sp. 1274761.0]OBK71143.1 hypothetical protein A5651_01035 [Mycobacterium sp. 1274761.0]